jgi:hypothetical protein
MNDKIIFYGLGIIALVLLIWYLIKEFNKKKCDECIHKKECVKK